MAAAEKPLEFHAKRPWGPEKGLEDPDEDEEDDNDETEDAFSLQEVLRLGGTKVMAAGSRRKETGVWRGREWNCPASSGLSGPAAPELRSRSSQLRLQLRNVLCAFPALLSRNIARKTSFRIELFFAVSFLKM